MSRDNVSEEDVSNEQLLKSTKNPVTCNVLLLDGTDYQVVLSKNDLSQVLVDRVAEKIKLTEKEYFSCSYMFRNARHWIHPDKEINKAGKRAKWTFSFELKFYPLDPIHLRQDGTRYLAFLQLRLDIINGKLPSSFLTHSLLGSYAVQSDLGDFNPAVHTGGIEYLKDIRFTEKNTEEMLEKIAEIHATHIGQAPEDAEMNFLDNAKNIAQYGVHLHKALDASSDPVNVGVCGTGLVIFKDQLRVRRFPWAKILKIAYKKNKFFVKIREDKNLNEPEETIIYLLEDNKLAKRLWRMAVEHHGFFRLKQPDELQGAQFPHFGIKFRYAGPTQFQATDGTIDRLKRPAFKVNRKASTRFTGARALITPAAEVPGFSTDRGEEVMVDSGRSNTLDLKKRMNRSGSIPLVSSDNNDRNLSVIDPGGNYGDGKVTVTSTGVSYARQPYYQEGTAPKYDQYGNPVLYGDDYSVDGSTLQSGAKPRYEQSVSTNGHYDDSETDNSFRYQDDRRLLRNGDGGYSGQGKWAVNVKSSTTKTSTRTYTDTDGTIITEHITEKDGVIEKRIEKRSRNTIAPAEDFDYDKALLDAIQSVTDMNPDASVQKIEIHTKTESSA